MNTSKIVIIGAGASGIGAAKRLLENGFRDVVILEATDRIGGRVHSVPFSSGIIDLGAQWVSDENVVYEMMKDHFVFGDTAIGIRDAFLDSSGEQLDYKKCKQLKNLADGMFLETNEMLESNETYGKFLKRKYYEALATAEFDPELAKKVLQIVQNEVKVLYGLRNWDEMPAKVIPIAVYIDSNQTITWKTSGYKTFVDFLVNEGKNFKLKEKVRLYKKVMNINWKSAKAVVKCTDGSEFIADHVISTIPQGVLRAHHATLFTPKLPEQKVKAIDSIGMGTLGKIFLEFEENFFTTETKHFSFVWSESDLAEIVGTDKEWLVQLSSFTHVDGFDKLVEGLVAGEFMREFETYEDSKIIDDCMWFIGKFFRKSVKQPVNIARTRWLTDENFLGSYSFACKGDGDSMDILGQPILNADKKPILLFGGEATNGANQGYVHGAYEMGLRVAQEVINFYNQ